MPAQVTDATKVKSTAHPRPTLIDTNGKQGGATFAAAQKTQGYLGWHPDENTETFRITDAVTPRVQIVNPNNQ